MENDPDLRVNHRRKERLRRMFFVIQLALMLCAGIVLGILLTIAMKDYHLNNLPFQIEDAVVGVDIEENVVCLELQDKRGLFYTSSQGYSMYPNVLPNTFMIYSRPENITDIEVGSIIVWWTDVMDYGVVHRVIEIGDDGSWYAITKGDNNLLRDKQKIRYAEVRGILVGVLH